MAEGDASVIFAEPEQNGRSPSESVTERITV